MLLLFASLYVLVCIALFFFFQPEVLRRAPSSVLIEENIVVSFYEDPSRVEDLLQGICDTFNDTHKDCLFRNKKDDIAKPFCVLFTSLNASYHGYAFTIVAEADPTFSDMTIQSLRKMIAQTMFDHKIKMAEENKFYRTRMTQKEK